MRDFTKYSVRQMKSRAYANFARCVEETVAWSIRTSVDIFDCLSRASLNEKNAVSAERSREMLRQETPAADPPPELSNQTIAKYYREAARMYEAAATYAVRQHDLCRALRRYRKAAQCGDRCNELLACGDPEVLAAAENHREKAALIRYEIARRSVWRKKLTLGLASRLR